MRVIVFSDVHAIMPALRALEQDGIAQQVDTYWCLGDLLGYGVHPLPVLRHVRRMMERYPGFQIILGNHDWEVLGRFGDTTFTRVGSNILSNTLLNPLVIKIAQEHRDAIHARDASLLEWLGQWDTKANPLPGYHLVHGTYHPDCAQSLNRYTSDSLQAKQQVNDLRVAQNGHSPFRMLAVGHYHVPALWYWNPLDESMGEVPDVWAQEWFTFENLAYRPVVFNPGSTSFPRVTGPAATSSYVLLEISDDLNSVRMGFRPVAFDWTMLVEPDTAPMGKLNRPDYLREQLMQCPLPPEVAAQYAGGEA